MIKQNGKTIDLIINKHIIRFFTKVAETISYKQH